jgi:hypothetical protein
MYRVALALVLAAWLAACSLNTSSVTSGFVDNPPDTAAISQPGRSESAALGADAGAQRVASASAKPSGTRVAKLDDKVPAGSFEKAPPGALGDRDYSQTALDPERARDLINQYRAEKKLKPLKLNAELTAAAKALARSRQVGPHLALRLRRLQPVGPRQALGLQGQARRRERGHRPGHVR